MQDIEKEFGPTSWSINNKTSVYIITVLLCVLGIFAYIKLGKEKFPDIVIPRIIVATVYPGTSPTDIENLVTRHLDKEIKGINGVKHQLHFEPGLLHRRRGVQLQREGARGQAAHQGCRG
jgi:multidrug efflux pump